MERLSELDPAPSERAVIVLDDEVMFLDEGTLVVEGSDAVASVADVGFDEGDDDVEDVIEVGDEVLVDA